MASGSSAGGACRSRGTAASPPCRRGTTGRWWRPGWARPDGLHLDPWIRTHQRLGASILGPAPRSMVITGTVAEWEGWTAMAFPRTGTYVVPDALDLVDIDRERDRGTYAETNLWMRHL